MHPMVATKDPGIMKRRATTVEYKSCGCLLRNIYMEGTDVIGEIETLSSFFGPDIAKMILFDKVNIGFSLRALGSVDTKPDGTIIVLEPIKPITYDLVSNPSHARARVLEFLPESVGSDVDDSKQIVCESATESDILLLKQDGVNVNYNNLIHEHNFINDILNDKFNQAIKKIKFRF